MYERSEIRSHTALNSFLMMPTRVTSAGKHLLVAAKEPPTGTRRDVRAPHHMNSPGTLCDNRHDAQVRPGNHNGLFGAEDLPIKSEAPRSSRHQDAKAFKWILMKQLT